MKKLKQHALLSVVAGIISGMVSIVTLGLHWRGYEYPYMAEYYQALHAENPDAGYAGLDPGDSEQDFYWEEITASKEFENLTEYKLLQNKDYDRPPPSFVAKTKQFAGDSWNEKENLFLVVKPLSHWKSPINELSNQAKIELKAHTDAFIEIASKRGVVITIGNSHGIETINTGSFGAIALDVWNEVILISLFSSAFTAIFLHLFGKRKSQPNDEING